MGAISRAASQVNGALASVMIRGDCADTIASRVAYPPSWKRMPRPRNRKASPSALLTPPNVRDGHMSRAPIHRHSLLSDAAARRHDGAGRLVSLRVLVYDGRTHKSSPQRLVVGSLWLLHNLMVLCEVLEVGSAAPLGVWRMCSSYSSATHADSVGLPGSQPMLDIAPVRDSAWQWRRAHIAAPIVAIARQKVSLV